MTHTKINSLNKRKMCLIKRICSIRHINPLRFIIKFSYLIEIHNDKWCNRNNMSSPS